MKKLELTCLRAGLYEYSGRHGTWWISHRTGEYAGEDHWVYFRVDEEAAGTPESRPQDLYATKRDAVAGLREKLGV